MAQNQEVITCTAPVNMAVIKYWGKRDQKLNLPVNSSLSATLNQDNLCTTTTVIASPDFTEDEIYLNGVKEEINTERIQRCLQTIRDRGTNDKIRGWKVHIITKNNFPTAAGLASSASGFCCLVVSMSKLFQVKGDISTIARLGSGSACRSVYGGWVSWEMGNNPDGSDSRAVQVADENHWKDMRMLVCVVNDQKKDTSSTSGMQRSVETSKLLQERIKFVPERMKQMETAILNRDFEAFADLTMRDSDSFHSVCADTDPPIFYMNETSKRIVQVVNALNSFSNRKIAAYTFDAGPNAVIFSLDENIPLVLQAILHFFPSTQQVADDIYVRNPELLSRAKKLLVPEQVVTQLKQANVEPQQGALKYILTTSVGPGPQVLENVVLNLEEKK